MPGETISVLLVDDHAVVRQGLRAFFEMLPDIDVVGEADDGAAALRELALLTASGSPPDVVVMDLLMPQMDGDEAIRRVLAQAPDVRVLVMTSFREPERVRAALAAGASGYLLKDARADEVAAAVRATHAGELHLDPAVARELGRHLLAPQQRGGELTTREREVLVRVAQGLTNQQIATALRISERTARTHVSNILTKLGLSSRTQAATWAIRQGLVDAR
ncbi:response regulator transcription factor [Pseudonocardia zijingensis]|jgi:DNA-binding NarL/FixJ family response regulator|uniref:Response regulator transcription factor n=1 Tax=Pseudonocardia zijingensis TaxID=153376 RepID=A0ABN1N800_9PSEU